MKKKSLANWEAFESEISLLYETLETRRARAGVAVVSDPLFRGHADASWELKTTLERYSTKQYGLYDYFQIMLGVRPALESFTEKAWAFSSDYTGDESMAFPPQGYEFMVYLRHHGFPSPLLDWTRSPYVAAFFAFQSKVAYTEKNVAIYSYVEYCGRGKSWTTVNPTVFGIERYMATDRRHHMQQSQYTFCKKEVDRRHVYCSHEEAFQLQNGQQDILTKYLIPRSERPKVLEKLNLMNIHSHSLFGSEESLMETLAYWEIERRTLRSTMG